MKFTLEHAIIIVVALALLYYVVQHRNLLTDLSGIPDRDHSELKAVKEKHLFGGIECADNNKTKINNESEGTLSLDIENVPTTNPDIADYFPGGKLYYYKNGAKCEDITINAEAYHKDYAKQVCGQYCENGWWSDSPCTLDETTFSGNQGDIPDKLNPVFDEKGITGERFSIYKCRPYGDCKRGTCK